MKGLFGSLFCTAALFSLSSAQAQLSVTSPASNSSVTSCDDFATQDLNDPWDMSNTADLNNYFDSTDISGVSGANFSGGNFNATTTGSGATLYLFSPLACGAYPVGGRYGQDLNLNTSKYNKLSIRMYTDLADPFGIRFIWDRSCNYAASSRTVTQPYPILPGWHTYTIPFDSASLDTATNTTAWASQAVTGIAILPTTQTGANVKIDWVRLEDANTCGSYNATYTAATSGNDNLYSLWLDDDNNPFNGYFAQLKTAQTASGAGSASINTLGIGPGSYKVVGLLDSDYRTLESTNPWDMNDSSDILTVGGETSYSFSGGMLTGVTGDGGGNIYLKLTDGGIDTSKYKYLSFRITRTSSSQPIRFLWNNGFHDFYPADSVGNDTYQLDLSSEGTWTGTKDTFIVRPAIDAGGGVPFSIDFISLRSSGYDASRSADDLASATTASAGYLVVNQPPTFSLETPNEKGGEEVRPWNMNQNDLVIFSNLNGAADAAHSGETQTTFLPDVRTVDGLRGDFFKGTNVDGSDDPNNYSTFPFGVTDPITFSSSDYHNLCFKLFIDRAFDLGGGSVARVLWKAQGQDFKGSDDLVLISDHWSGTNWYEYCVDMNNLQLDGTTDTGWSGTIEAFRVDPHEFNTATSYYFDYIKLRKDFQSRGNKFTIVYDLDDPDSAATADLYYTSASTATSGTLITTLSEGQRSYVWDTSAVPNGTYHLYAIATDGTNSVTRLAKGALIVNNATAAGAAPVLSLDAPTDSLAVCSALQVKGYALQSDRYEDVASVEVSIDGTLIDVIHPNLFNPSAKAAYPSVDSSNSGFNKSYSVSAYSPGAHTVLVKALSTDGQSTSHSITITKQGSGCPDPVVDPDPAGTPLGADVAVVTPTPTPTPTPTQTAPTITKLSHDRHGTVTIQLGQVGSAGCTDRIYVGTKSNAITTSAKLLTVSSSEASSNKISLQAKGVTVKKKKLSKVFFKIVKSCSGYENATSHVKALAIKTSNGTVTSLRGFGSKLGKAIKRTAARRKRH